jgi:hypothetical protein
MKLWIRLVDGIIGLLGRLKPANPSVYERRSFIEVGGRESPNTLEELVEWRKRSS